MISNTVLYEIVTNRILIIPICSWTIAQLLKVAIVLIQEKQLDLRYLVVSGGMPSAHSAVVTSLATSIAFIQGFGSVNFGISVILALIVMYDAAGLRQSVGKQSIVLNRILQELRLHRPATELGRDLREFVGHTSLQVLIGGLLGIAVAFLWFILTGF
ncbi:MAG: divergent PAP2 family protein [Chloroflexota bacterium]